MNSKVKKAIKITSISIGSLLLLLIITSLILMWFVFTPEKLTPIVRKQLKNYVTCETQLNEVELTLFSTFPKLSLRIEEVTLINPMKGSISDTLLQASSIDMSLNIRALLFDNKVLVNGITLNETTLNAYIDSTGKANYMVMKEQSSDTTSEPFDLISLEFIAFKNCHVSYMDDEGKLYVSAGRLNGKLKELEINDKHFKTKILLHSKDAFAQMGVDPYWQHKEMTLGLDFTYLFENGDFGISNLDLKHQDTQVKLDGVVKNDIPNDGYTMVLDYELETQSVAELITLIPPFFATYFEGLTLDGYGKMNGKVEGAFNDDSMPLITGDLQLDRFSAIYNDMKNVPITECSTNMNLYIDMNQEDKSLITLKSLKFKTLQSDFEANGIIDQIFGDIRFDGNLIAAIDLPTISKEFLSETGYDVKGKMKINTYAKTTLNEVMDVDLKKIRLKGDIELFQFSAVGEGDTVNFTTPEAKIHLELNKPAENKRRQFLIADIRTTDFKGNMGLDMNVQLTNSILHVTSSDFTDSLKSLEVKCNYSISSFIGHFNGNSANMRSLVGSMSMDEMQKIKQNIYKIDASAINIQAQMIDSLGMNRVTAESIALKFDVKENYGVDNALLRWVPTGNITIQNGNIDTYLVPETIQIPILSFTSQNDSYEITKSKIILGKSDFSLEGTLWNVEPYLKKEGVLKGDFSFKSNVTDINRLMDLTSADVGSEEVNTTPVPRAEGDPYLVPLNVDLVLKTQIDQALFNNSIIKNINGGVVVKDGKLILDDLKVELPGSKVIVTAIYRTPRKNHLFIGVDYHMLEVEIEQLLTIIPDLDTIMPMLKSFKGKGEFHFVAETYMFSNYDLKRSTIRGAAAIAGQDLVLMDGETFTEISKTLMFSKKTQNRVDSLAAEFTLYKNEIDVYPFSLKMDKYRAVISGKHNLDMSFIYHISLVESPILVKLGVDVSGTMDDLKIRPVVPRYAELYRPARQDAITNEQLNLKKMIREALMTKFE
ncbi:MAG: hypothetical protein CVU02_03090 [Bacteroidetes bacterium HGW-Bacteroidetes-19]|nr:MAG: hypothetical protein CVU02_03090 [Bacteroidetes bacterium HGW-Bacteroidetes-19]